jgi:hypothetical protein
MDIQKGDEQPGAAVVASHPARCLDIFRRRLGLSEHDHETEPRDIESNRNHVGRDRDVDALLATERQCQPTLCVGDLVGALARGKLDHVLSYFAVGERPSASPIRFREP